MAVLLVVLNHLRFRYLLGGYVGVDIFFVISGYLIGSSLIADLRAGTFSLTGFYERRARRILPALLCVLLFSTLLAYRYFLPGALLSYCRSLVAALFSYSNFFFSGQIGYFDAARINRALLHTWSLGVEEQFYVAFPLLLLLVFRWVPLRLRSALWTLTILSLAGSVWVAGFSPTAAFYSSPLRAWELFAGVLTSQYGLSLLRSRILREAAALVGTALIVYASLSFTSASMLRAGTTFLPCVGAVLLLAAGQVGPTTVGSMLSWSPMTFLGRISYSLYLWHWPIFVFLSSSGLVVGQEREHVRMKMLTLALSMVAAVLSWWLIETPFRRRPFAATRWPFFLTIGLAAALLLGFAVMAFHENGFPGRFSAEALRVGAFQDNTPATNLWRSGSCYLNPEHSIRDFNMHDCLSDSGERQYLILGDSTAAHLYSGLVQVFPHIHFNQATVSGCKPLYDTSHAAQPPKGNCATLLRFIFDEYLPTHHPDAVILGGAWESVDLPSLGKTIRELQKEGITPIVFGPPLSMDTSLPLLLAMDIEHRPTSTDRNLRLRPHLQKEYIAVDEAMHKEANDVWHVRYVSYYEELCPPSPANPAQVARSCLLMTDEGEPLLFDTHHLTGSGSIVFASRMREDGVLP